MNDSGRGDPTRDGSDTFRLSQATHALPIVQTYCVAAAEAVPKVSKLAAAPPSRSPLATRSEGTNESRDATPPFFLRGSAAICYNAFRDSHRCSLRGGSSAAFFIWSTATPGCAPMWRPRCAPAQQSGCPKRHPKPSKIRADPADAKAVRTEAPRSPRTVPATASMFTRPSSLIAAGQPSTQMAASVNDHVSCKSFISNAYRKVGVASRAFRGTDRAHPRQNRRRAGDKPSLATAEEPRNQALWSATRLA
jgi:hypothetical protein